VATNTLKMVIEGVGAAGTALSLDKVARSTERVGKASRNTGREMGAFGKQGLNASNSMRNLAGSIAVVQGPLGPVSGRISALGAIMGRLNVQAVAATAGITLTGVAIHKILSVTKQYESQMGKINAIIKATGGTAELTAAQIDTFAIKLGEDTLASAVGVREAAAALMSFRSISGDTFKQTLSLAQDLAATFGGSLKDKTVQIAKALEDPKTGLDALRRSGVMFTEQQKAQIKVLVESGHKLEAQKIILAELNKEVGGAAVGAAASLAGALDTLGERWDNLFIAIGKTTDAGTIASGVVNTLSGAILMLTDAMDTESVRSMGVQIASMTEEISRANKAIAERKGQLLKPFEWLGIIDDPTPDMIKYRDTMQAVLDEKVALRSVKLNSGNEAAFFQAIEAGATAAEAAIIAMAQAEADAIERKTFRDKPASPGGKSVESEKKKLQSLLDANATYQKQLAVQADMAFADKSQKEDIRFKAELAKIKERRDKILASKVISIEQIKQVNDSFRAETDAAEEIHAAKSIAIIQAEADAKDQILTTSNETHAEKLRQLQEIVDSFGVTAAESEQIKFEAETENRRIAFDQEKADLIQHGVDISDLQDAHDKEEELRTKAHDKKMAKLKEKELKANANLVAGALGDLSSLMQSKNRKLFEIGKVAAIAQATIKGAVAVVNSYEKGTELGGPIVGAVFGAAAAAAAAVQIQSIASTSFGGGGSVSAPSSGGGAGSVGGGGGRTPSPPIAPPTISPQPSVTIYVNGVISQDQLVNEIVPLALSKQINNNDFTFIDPNSAQGQMFVRAG